MVKNGLINKSIFLRKVILENFLSFQRDEVDFSIPHSNNLPRFILIIGPNWSGKTSIFQAIKFALGSNERDERYKKWSDFIRNGQTHAMVELHIQYHGELIKIRRTVVRGKSPFFEIQHIPDRDFKRVHVNEIQKLVTDLEINPDNQFAFVSQGKIDAIKNLKPIELCSFLEEGIGLKGLREEILQQKYGVLSLNTELRSLVTRKNTLNFNLDLLTPKLERLEEKKNLLGIRNKYTDELLWANKDILQKDIENLEGSFKESKVKIESISKKAEECHNLILEKEKEVIEIDDNLNILSKKTGELEYKKKELVKKIDAWQKEKIIEKKKLDELSAEVSKIGELVKNNKKQRKKFEDEIKIVKNKKQSIKSKIDLLIKEQTDLIKKIKENESFLAKYNKLVNEKEDYNKDIQENEDKIKNTNKDINDLFQSLMDIDHKLEKNKWFLENPSDNLLMQLDKELKRITVSILKIGTEVEQLDYEKSKKMQKFKVLQTALRERKIVLSPNISILKEEIKKRELEDRVIGPIIEFLKYDDELSYAIESVLGERLLNSFIVSDWDTLYLLERLKKKFNAYCNIYIPKNVNITPYPKISASGVIGYLAELINIIDDNINIQKVIYSKIKNCLVVKDNQSAKELYKTKAFKGKCVTLQGKQIISYKYAYESPHIKRLKGLLSAGTQKEQSELLEKEINSLNDKILELQVNQAKFDKQQGEIFRKKEAFGDLLFNFKEKERLTTIKNQLYNQIYSLEQANIDIKANLKILTEEVNNFEAQKEPEFFLWNKRTKEIPGEISELNNDLEKWDKKLNENLELLEAIKNNLNLNENNLKIIKLNYDEKKSEFQKSDQKAFEIYRKLENLENEILSIEKKLAELREKKTITQQKKSEIDKAHLQVKLNLEQEIFKQSSLQHELGMKKADLKRILSEVGKYISEEEITIRPIEDINNDILKIDKELLKYLDVDDSLLIEKEQIITGLKEITKNQNEIENDIKSAIKTEKKLETTYFDKFKVVLKELNTKINQKFKSADIKAYCTLELIGNFVELGVDIKAAISKDQLKSCTALSGGQISMISISLILSLQEIKPSPLCMFDEAGMFLDDKNSEASYQMIKSTLEENSIQLLMFLPKSSNALYSLADKLIGVARVGKKEVSTIFKPKILKEK
ncbi:MAG: AAA family ATPase [Candidatus Hermodarchaeota archaeon]